MSETTFPAEKRHSKDVESNGSSNSDFHVPNADSKPPGVLTIEAARAVASWQLWVLYIGIGLTAYVYGLDNNTMYAYLQAAANNANKYPLYSTLSTINTVIIAVGKFPIAKLSDVFGRAQGYALSLALWLMGFVMIAGSQNFGTVIAGVIFYSFGNTGTQIMQQIVIADALTTRWRGLGIGLLSLPYIINFAVAPKIVGSLAPTTDLLLTPPPQTWRWGPGSFAIICCIAVAPIIFALALSQQQAKKQGKAPRHPYRAAGPSKGFRQFADDMDLGGLFLIAAGWLLVLLPLSLHTYAPNGWNTPYIIGMIVTGFVLLIILGFYEWLVAPQPILVKRFLKSKDVMFPALIAFFDFVSFYLSWSSAYYFVVILKNWGTQDALYFSNAQSLCLTVFGIAAGAANYIFRRYKWSMVFAAAVRVLGLGLMIAYRHAGATTAQLVIPQILQGLGGGILGINLQVSAQVSVPHQDVAIVTAFVLLFAEVGGAVGTAILGAIQTTVLPREFARLLPGQPDVQASLFASPLTATATYPLGSPVRDALIEAWSLYMREALIVAICLAVIPLVLSCFLADKKLNNKQNLVEYDEEGNLVQHSLK